MRNFANSLKRGIAILGVAAVVAVAGAVPASATSSSDCYLQYVCMFKNASYAGGIARFTADVTSYVGKSFISPISNLNDETSSIYNNNVSCNTDHWTDHNFTGSRLSTLKGGNGYPNIGFNDSLSSHNNCP